MKYLGEMTIDWNGKLTRYFFLHCTDQINFNVKEGAGGLWVDFEQAKKLLDDNEQFEKVQTLIKF